MSEPCGHDLGDADRAEVAGGAADVEFELFGEHGAELGGAGDGVELGLVDVVVAAEEGDDGTHRAPAGSAVVPMKATHLMSCEGWHAEEGADIGDGALARGDQPT